MTRKPAPAGKNAPNYVLHPPTGLALKPGVPHMLGVAEAVRTFHRPGKVTRCFWCACAAIHEATNDNPMVDVAS
jgi:hypothetical protein